MVSSVSFMLRSHEIMSANCTGGFLSVIDKNGDEILFFKVGKAIPCSLSLCRKKAETSYHFMKDNHVAYSEISRIGYQPLIDDMYCFIPGGIFKAINTEEFYCIGVSTENPSLDNDIAQKISELI